MTEKHKEGFYEKYIKMPLDFCLAFIALILLSPLMLLTAILVKIKLGSPVIFKQERAGKDGKPFYMYKFRSMSEERDEEGNLLPDEQRLGRFGQFLRSTFLDELPSLINVLHMNMAIVGPRCLYVRYNDRYSEEQARRLETRPGITGLAQINGRNLLTWDEKFSYDVQYVDNVSFFGDLSIFLKSIGKVLKREGISSPNCATMEEFMGNEAREAADE